MATIKSFTSLEQSRKLAEILPLESADMYYGYGKDKPEFLPLSDVDVKCLSQPCWSLASLLGALPYPYIEQNYKGKWICRVEHENTTYLWEDSNPIDACVAMIELLHEQKLL